MRTHAIVGLLVVAGCGYNPHQNYSDLPDGGGQAVRDAAPASPDTRKPMDAGGAGGSDGAATSPRDAAAIAGGSGGSAGTASSGGTS
ncbi:MAG: hypothetical protein WBV96_23320, partial [Polyangia bacterium]